MSNPRGVLPSLSDLLDRPALRGLSDRLNRNVVVGRVRRYLDDLQADVRAAAGRWKAPDVTDLADRFARWILAEEHRPPRRVLNATGDPLHELAPTAWPEAAVAAWNKAAREGWSEASTAGDDRLATALRQAAGAEAALATTGAVAGLSLVLTSLAATRGKVAIARRSLIELPDGRRLDDLVRGCGCRLRELGAANVVRLDDYQQALERRTSAVLLTMDEAVDTTLEPALADLAALCQRKSLPLVVFAPRALPVDMEPYGWRATLGAAELVAAGADAVVLGDAWLPGSGVGAIVGRRLAVQGAAAAWLAADLSPRGPLLAAVTAAGQLLVDPAERNQSLRLFELLATPLDNLRNRAERMAPQLAACPGIVAEAVELGGAPRLAARQLAPTASWGVALRPTNGDVDALATALMNGAPAILGRPQTEQLVLDLRSVPASDDARLIAAVQAVVESGEADPSDAAGGAPTAAAIDDA